MSISYAESSKLSSLALPTAQNVAMQVGPAHLTISTF